MKPTSEILKRIYGISMCHSQAIFTRLFRYLLREDIYLKAYENLYANKGVVLKVLMTILLTGLVLNTYE